MDEAIKEKIDAALQKPAGLTKTELVGVGTNGQENIEIGDNLTLANGKLSATGGGSGGITVIELPRATSGTLTDEQFNLIKADPTKVEFRLWIGGFFYALFYLGRFRDNIDYTYYTVDITIDNTINVKKLYINDKKWQLTDISIKKA